MKTLRPAVICILAFVGIGMSAATLGFAQNTIPPRALLVADHLRGQTFEELVPGLLALKTRASNGVEIIALKIAQPEYQFLVTKQADKSGEWVDDMGKRESGLVAFNGGFFSINKKGQKYSVGLLAKDNVRYSAAWKKSGGFLSFQQGNIDIVPTLGNVVPSGEAVLQSKPVLIEPGGKWAMNTNQAIRKKRMLVCKDGSGDVVLLAVIAGGLSLYEAGWVMRSSDVGGYFGCDSAIAMDGGGSTQIWVKDRPDLSYVGETPVHNGVVIQQQ